MESRVRSLNSSQLLQKFFIHLPFILLQFPIENEFHEIVRPPSHWLHVLGTFATQPCAVLGSFSCTPGPNQRWRSDRSRDCLLPSTTGPCNHIPLPLIYLFKFCVFN
nr:hypothetical protein CFP56_01829 [Quercus suber]